MKKTEHAWINDDADELFLAIQHLENLAEIRAFVRDLLTEREIVEFANRWKVARMLDAGISYARIEKVTGASSATIARVQGWLRDGAGGYQNILRKMK